ncbi:hypothetical protein CAUPRSCDRAFT_10706 [Caulochytrium protostelioides]|uniref:Uncharacterized protein n=1 Tax=Caulochytrium protostelioides TaxID=1555241 RepID=A0A4P9X0V7_9FUNG|nr:hypothetical protein CAUPRSCDRAFT_10706 [Caulochytrium protostelioides]
MPQVTFSLKRERHVVPVRPRNRQLQATLPKKQRSLILQGQKAAADEAWLRAAEICTQLTVLNFLVEDPGAVKREALRALDFIQRARADPALSVTASRQVRHHEMVVMSTLSRLYALDSVACYDEAFQYAQRFKELAKPLNQSEHEVRVYAMLATALLGRAEAPFAPRFGDSYDYAMPATLPAPPMTKSARALYYESLRYLEATRRELKRGGVVWPTDMSQSSLESVESQFGRVPTESAVLAAMALAKIRLDILDEAERALNAAMQLAETVSDRPTLRKACLYQAVLCDTRKEYGAAIAAVRRASSLFQLDDDADGVSRCYWGMSHRYQRLSDWTRALTCMQQYASNRKLVQDHEELKKAEACIIAIQAYQRASGEIARITQQLKERAARPTPTPATAPARASLETAIGPPAHRMPTTPGAKPRPVNPFLPITPIRPGGGRFSSMGITERDAEERLELHEARARAEIQCQRWAAAADDLATCQSLARTLEMGHDRIFPWVAQQAGCCAADGKRDEAVRAAGDVLRMLARLPASMPAPGATGFAPYPTTRHALALLQLETLWLLRFLRLAMPRGPGDVRGELERLRDIGLAWLHAPWGPARAPPGFLAEPRKADDIVTAGTVYRAAMAPAAEGEHGGAATTNSDDDDADDAIPAWIYEWADPTLDRTAWDDAAAGLAAGAAHSVRGAQRFAQALTHDALEPLDALAKHYRKANHVARENECTQLLQTLRRQVAAAEAAEAEAAATAAAAAADARRAALERSAAARRAAVSNDDFLADSPADSESGSGSGSGSESELDRYASSDASDGPVTRRRASRQPAKRRRVHDANSPAQSARHVSPRQPSRVSHSHSQRRGARGAPDRGEDRDDVISIATDDDDDDDSAAQRPPPPPPRTRRLVRASECGSRSASAHTSEAEGDVTLVTPLSPSCTVSSPDVVPVRTAPFARPTVDLKTPSEEDMDGVVPTAATAPSSRSGQSAASARSRPRPRLTAEEESALLCLVPPSDSGSETVATKADAEGNDDATSICLASPPRPAEPLVTPAGHPSAHRGSGWPPARHHRAPLRGLNRHHHGGGVHATAATIESAFAGHGPNHTTHGCESGNAAETTVQSCAVCHRSSAAHLAGSCHGTRASALPAEIQTAGRSCRDSAVSVADNVAPLGPFIRRPCHVGPRDIPERIDKRDLGHDGGDGSVGQMAGHPVAAGGRRAQRSRRRCVRRPWRARDQAGGEQAARRAELNGDVSRLRPPTVHERAEARDDVAQRVGLGRARAVRIPRRPEIGVAAGMAVRDQKSGVQQRHMGRDGRERRLRCIGAVGEHQCGPRREMGRSQAPVCVRRRPCETHRDSLDAVGNAVGNAALRQERSREPRLAARGLARAHLVWPGCRRAGGRLEGDVAGRQVEGIAAPRVPQTRVAEPKPVAVVQRVIHKQAGGRARVEVAVGRCGLPERRGRHRVRHPGGPCEVLCSRPTSAVVAATLVAAVWRRDPFQASGAAAPPPNDEVARHDVDILDEVRGVFRPNQHTDVAVAAGAAPPREDGGRVALQGDLEHREARMPRVGADVPVGRGVVDPVGNRGVAVSVAQRRRNRHDGAVDERARRGGLLALDRPQHAAAVRRAPRRQRDKLWRRRDVELDDVRRALIGVLGAVTGVLPAVAGAGRRPRRRGGRPGRRPAHDAPGHAPGGVDLRVQERGRRGRRVPQHGERARPVDAVQPQPGRRRGTGLPRRRLRPEAAPALREHDSVGGFVAAHVEAHGGPVGPLRVRHKEGDARRGACRALAVLLRRRRGQADRAGELRQVDDEHRRGRRRRRQGSRGDAPPAAAGARGPFGRPVVAPAGRRHDPGATVVVVVVVVGRRGRADARVRRRPARLEKRRLGVRNGLRNGADGVAAHREAVIDLGLLGREERRDRARAWRTRRPRRRVRRIEVCEWIGELVLHGGSRGVRTQTAAGRSRADDKGRADRLGNHHRRRR